MLQKREEARGCVFPINQNFAASETLLYRLNILYAIRTIYRIHILSIRFVNKYFRCTFIVYNIVILVNEIRERLKLVIESSGYSLRGFAREIGITPGGLSGIINGRSKILSGMFLKNLEFRFNINPVWLESGEGSQYVKKFLIEEKDEIELILKYRKLDFQQKKSLSVMTDALYIQQEKQNMEHSLVAEKNRKKTGDWQ